MDPANNMGARLINQANNVGANVINRANNQWRVGSIINSTTGRMNRAINTFRGLTSGITIRGVVAAIFVAAAILSVVGVVIYGIYYGISTAIDGFQSGNSNQRPRKISRKSRISGKK